MSTLSFRPGERVGVVGENRSAVLRQLAGDPELLVLDEPTNLDVERLLAHRGPLVMATHDRLLLDRVATTVIEADGRMITRYGNGYAGYLAEKWSARKRWEREYLAWVTAIERGADDLWADPVPRPPDPLRFDAGAACGTVLAANGIAVRGELDIGELAVAAGSRLLVSGPGGSTLLSVLAGQRRPDTGSIVRSGRIGYLPRESVARTPQRSLLATFARGRPGTFDEHAERLLALGLFAEEDLQRPVGALSAGQLRRLDLARLLVSEVDVLLLDEPTDQLPPTLAEELEVALENYAGAVVVVSGDRMFRARWTGPELTLRPTARVS
ncbi:ATP-binding cassette domain-containing protein [Kutzneria kofuensis]|uniref:Macrolide transport system ATP-binding/permease protein n=1 Tax=Kutzneria kofuensis TaxID=103725 RepID=A0A7W9KEV3_9PSEU|nr:ATP-binding cassette domain-containing protein [Kutzneria kofuensis]MBB5891236.1 macrolide transport system ATP-binding/permease protein [Kutzneria kofuensis]